MPARSNPEKFFKKATAGLLLAIMLLSIMIPAAGAGAGAPGEAEPGGKPAYMPPEESPRELIVKYNDEIDINEIITAAGEGAGETDISASDAGSGEISPDAAGRREQGFGAGYSSGAGGGGKPSQILRSAHILGGVMEEEGVKIESVNDHGLALLSVEDPGTMLYVLELLTEDENIDYAEPNYTVQAFADFSSQQWGPQRIMAPSAWSCVAPGGGVSITVAVIDSGVDAVHPDLSGVVLPGRNFIAVNSKGQVYGSGNTSDDNGHGTHVAGIISAIYNNSAGIMGVTGPANVKILPLKVLRDDGKGTMFDVSNAIIYAADQGGADIINLSIGASSSSRTLENAVSYANGKGCLIVAAAGNESANVAATYPAAYPGVIAVGAIDQNNTRAYFSNYGDRLDVVAPGVSIISAIPAAIARQEMLHGTIIYGGPDEGYYRMMSGTSMAAPHVAGLVALYKTINPDADSQAIREKVTKTAADLGAPGKDAYYGWGLVNAELMLKGIAIPGYVAVSQPQANSEVYGTVTIGFGIDAGRGITGVELWLDNPVTGTQLATIPCLPGISAYTYDWNTTGTAEGLRTVYTVAKGAGVPAEAYDSVSLRVANTLEDGFVFQLLDPIEGAAVSDAAAELWSVSQTGVYTMISSVTSDDKGYIRVRGTSPGDVASYLITASGSHPSSNGTLCYFYYRKTLTSANMGQSGILEKTPSTRLINITLHGENGALSTPVLALAPHTGDRAHSVLDPWQPADNETLYYIDDGKYDFYAYWSPALDPSPASAAEATYFLIKSNEVVSASSTDLTFTYNNGVKVTADYHFSQPLSSGVFFLEGVKSGASFGIPFVDNIISSPVVYISPGEYKTHAQIDVPIPGGVLWQYLLIRDEAIEIRSGDASKVLDFGGGIVISKFEPVGDILRDNGAYYLNRGDIFSTENKITDLYGNALGYASNQSTLAPVSTSVLPEFAVYKLNGANQDACVFSESSAILFASSLWNGRSSSNVLQPPGEYRSILSYDGGPLGGIIQKAADFEIRTQGSGEDPGLGDVSGDGIIDMQDVLLIYQCFRGKITLTSIQSDAADVNCNGEINMQDVLLVYQYFRGKTTKFS